MSLENRREPFLLTRSLKQKPSNAVVQIVWFHGDSVWLVLHFITLTPRRLTFITSYHVVFSWRFRFGAASK